MLLCLGYDSRYIVVKKSMDEANHHAESERKVADYDDSSLFHLVWQRIGRKPAATDNHST